MRPRSTRSAVGAGLLLVTVTVGGALPAAADHASGHRAPSAQAPVLFAEDFVPPMDAEYGEEHGWTVGGFGGIAAGASVTKVPIVFVHGNQADAQNFFVVRDQLRADFDYSDQELWAISYGGLGYLGGSTPVANDGGEAEYAAAYPRATVNGNPQNNDVNVADVIAFIDAVRAYTGAEHVQVVAHSLGVTIIRKAMLVEPRLRETVIGVVGIAGANHGTSVCSGLEDDYYGCDEIAPDTAWLAELNAPGEAPGPTRWMTVYDGTGAADIFFVGPDFAQSPALDGAEINREWPGTSHNDLRVDPTIVADWATWLAAVETDHLAALPAAAVTEPEPEQSAAATADVTADEDPLPTTGGGTALVAGLALAGATLGRRRRR